MSENEKPISQKTVMEKLRDGDKLTQEDWDSLEVVWPEKKPIHGENDGAFMRGMNLLWVYTKLGIYLILLLWFIFRFSR